MEMKKLDFAETLKDSIAIGVKNAPSVVVAVALWLVTIWIPYINIGTTIAISLLPVELAKGSVINPLGIFDSKYRRYMGEYLITAGLMVIPIYIAFVFMIVPGIVLSLSWALSFYFLLGKGKKPMQAIKASNDATYGSKWTMFLVTLVFGIMVGIVFGILYAICLAINVGFITFLVIVRPDRARGFGPDGDRRIVLETAERQRGISLRHYFPKTACGSSFFV